MERLDQGRIHPKLEVPGLTCPGRESNPVGGEHSRKEPSEQLVNSYSEHEPTTVFKLRDSIIKTFC